MGLFLREPRDRGVYDAILRGHTILMYWVYLLRCDDDESWYIGYTTNLKTRLKDHLEKHGARTTRRKENWKLIYCEGYVNKKDAQGRERFLKSGSGRRFLKKQLKYYLADKV